MAEIIRLEQPESNNCERYVKEAKKKRRKAKDTSDEKSASDCYSKEQAEILSRIADKVAAQQPHSDESKKDVSKAKKKKRKDNRVENNSSFSRNEQPVSDAIVEKLGSEQWESEKSEGVAKKGKKKNKKKRDTNMCSENNALDYYQNEVETSTGTVEEVGPPQAENDKSEGDVQKAKKKKKGNTNCDKVSSERQVEGCGETAANKDKKKRKRECDGVRLEEREKREDNASCSANAQAKVSGHTAKRRENRNKRRKEEDNIGLEHREGITCEDSKEALDGINKASEGDNNDKKKKKKNNGEKKSKGEEEKAIRSNKKGKRVSFSDEVEVFPIDGTDKEGKSNLVHGRWFTKEEDLAILNAIEKYVQMKQLGEKGIEMVLRCRSHPEVKGCWNEIRESLPHRPVIAVYKRAHILLERSEKREWSSEEKEYVKRFYEQYGPQWKEAAVELGRSRIHVKDLFRRNELENLNKGPWTQDEYQNLFDLVNLDLQLKAQAEKPSDNRMLKDNISWKAISKKLATRPQYVCCLKWYQQLQPSLVTEGKWANSDDYALLEALQKVDADCVEDVDWDNLLDHRSGEYTRARWNEMVRFIGGHKERSFIEQVEILSNRYRPEMLEYIK